MKQYPCFPVERTKMAEVYSWFKQEILRIQRFEFDADLLCVDLKRMPTGTITWHGIPLFIEGHYGQALLNVITDITLPYPQAQLMGRGYVQGILLSIEYTQFSLMLQKQAQAMEQQLDQAMEQQLDQAMEQQLDDNTRVMLRHHDFRSVINDTTTLPIQTKCHAYSLQGRNHTVKLPGSTTGKAMLRSDGWEVMEIMASNQILAALIKNGYDTVLTMDSKALQAGWTTEWEQLQARRVALIAAAPASPLRAALPEMDFSHIAEHHFTHFNPKDNGQCHCPEKETYQITVADSFILEECALNVLEQDTVESRWAFITELPLNSQIAAYGPFMKELLNCIEIKLSAEQNTLVKLQPKAAQWFAKNLSLVKNLKETETQNDAVTISQYKCVLLASEIATTLTKCLLNPQSLPRQSHLLSYACKYAGELSNLKQGIKNKNESDLSNDLFSLIETILSHCHQLQLSALKLNIPLQELFPKQNVGTAQRGLDQLSFTGLLTQWQFCQAANVDVNTKLKHTCHLIQLMLQHPKLGQALHPHVHAHLQKNNTLPGNVIAFLQKFLAIDRLVQRKAPDEKIIDDMFADIEQVAMSNIEKYNHTTAEAKLYHRYFKGLYSLLAASDYKHWYYTSATPEDQHKAIMALPNTPFHLETKKSMLALLTAAHEQQKRQFMNDFLQQGDAGIRLLADTLVGLSTGTLNHAEQLLHFGIISVEGYVRGALTPEKYLTSIMTSYFISTCCAENTTLQTICKDWLTLNLLRMQNYLVQSAQAVISPTDNSPVAILRQLLDIDVQQAPFKTLERDLKQFIKHAQAPTRLKRGLFASQPTVEDAERLFRRLDNACLALLPVAVAVPVNPPPANP